MPTIREREGNWYVVDAWPDILIPQINHPWYRIGDRRTRPLVDGEGVVYEGDGYYRLDNGDCVRLARGGETTPTFFETEPVPRPKGRGSKSLRWRGGWRR